MGQAGRSILEANRPQNRGGSMDMEAVRLAHAKMEADIQATITRFCDVTGMRVDSVDVSPWETRYSDGHIAATVYQVRVIAVLR